MKYNKTDRRTANHESDYCIEWSDGTLVWVKDDTIVDFNDMLEAEQVNDLLILICTELKEYKSMYEGLCK